MHANFPCCATEFPINVEMIDADGKRVVGIFAATEPTRLAAADKSNDLAERYRADRERVAECLVAEQSPPPARHRHLR